MLIGSDTFHQTLHFKYTGTLREVVYLIFTTIPATIGRESRCRSQGEIANTPVGNLDSPMNPIKCMTLDSGEKPEKGCKLYSFLVLYVLA